MDTPYASLPATAFWRTGVADLAPDAIAGVYAPKFAIAPSTTVATLGSCFAQHMGRELRQRSFRWFEAEPAIAGFPKEFNESHQYGVFSFRTGNIYTPRMLRQWLEWASGTASPPDEMWEKDGRFVDPFRPTIEPDGFATPDDVLAARRASLAAIAASLPKIEVLVFTLGQTEAWLGEDVTYAMCPGTAGGTFDGARHRFHNFSTRECVADMEAAIALLKAANPQMRILLTVSPVPMVATASAEHVLVANGRTKSVLRAVAAMLAEERDEVDYFPSYELITQPPFRGMFYHDNMRTVQPAGVAFVMEQFFTAHGVAPKGNRKARRRLALNGKAAAKAEPATDDVDDVICEEVLLEAAAPRR